MKPDPQRIRALSGALSSIEAMWVGLPNPNAMKFHVGQLQVHLSQMLDDTPKRALAVPIVPEDLGPGDGPPDTELERLLKRLGNPDALTIRQIRRTADDAMSEWIRSHTHLARRRLAHCGYEKVHHPTGKDGGWPVNGNTVIYARRELSHEGRLEAAKVLARAERARWAAPKISAPSTRTPARATKSFKTQLPASNQGQSE